MLLPLRLGTLSLAALALGFSGCAFFSPKLGGDLPFDLLSARECLLSNGITPAEIRRNDEWALALYARLDFGETQSRITDIRFIPDHKPSKERAVLIEACREVAVLESAIFLNRLDRSANRSGSIGGLTRGQIYRLQGRLTPEPFLVYKDRFGFVKGKVGKVPEDYGKERSQIPEEE